MATVLAIGDTHCPGMRRGYVQFLQRIADKYAVNRVVHIGDAVDWCACSFHEKNPGISNALEERKKALRQMASLARAFPKVDWLIGNHDALPMRQAVAAGIPEEMLIDYADAWEVPWKTHPRFTKLEIDGVLYAHGDCGPGGKYAAINQAKAFMQSTVIGHFHAQAGVAFYANELKRVFGASTGCGIDHHLLAFEYGRKFPSKPVLGCVVVEGGRRAIFEPWLLPNK